MTERISTLHALAVALGLLLWAGWAGAGPLGAPCTTAADCDSGYCADGRCCFSACTESCAACDGVDPQGDYTGECAPHDGPARGGRAPCAGEGTDCGGRCDGFSFECFYPTPGTACGERICSGAVANIAHCDGQGHCGKTAPENCTPYACIEGSCMQVCGTDEHCAPGFRCEQLACVVRQETTCDGDHTLVAADGEETDCSPYHCAGTGTCLNRCTSAADCVEGTRCTAEGACVEAEEPPAAEAGGCALRRARTGSDGPGGSGVVLLALLLAAARRRPVSRATSAAPRKRASAPPDTRCGRPRGRRSRRIARAVALAQRMRTRASAAQRCNRRARGTSVAEARHAPVCRSLQLPAVIASHRRNRP